MPAGPEAHPLRGIVHGRLGPIVGALQRGQIHEDLGRRRLPRERREAQGTGHGLASQISDAYSARGPRVFASFSGLLQTGIAGSQ